MPPDLPVDAAAANANPYAPAEIAEILRERGWLENTCEGDPAMQGWLARAAELLGPHAADRDSLAELLSLIFHYDAAALLKERASQAVLARSGAREVIRELANRVLEGGDVDSDWFKEIIDSMKLAVPYRSRALFHPIRLALAGRAGEGELDRVILLLDEAARLDFATPVKNARQRLLEFCAALD
jgi:predicted secreted protein